MSNTHEMFLVRDIITTDSSVITCYTNTLLFQDLEKMVGRSKIISVGPDKWQLPKGLVS